MLTIPIATNALQLLGFMLFPTILTHLGELPLFFMAESPAPITPLDFIGVSLCLVSIAISFLADQHLHMFNQRKNEGDVLDVGLWGLSRHPNYLGEIGFWWGLWLVGCSTDLRITHLESSREALEENWGRLLFGVFGFVEFKFLGNWIWMAIGPVAITLLFVYVSIPIIEKRSMERRYLYRYLIDDVSPLLLCPRKHKGSVMIRYKEEFEEYKKLQNSKKTK